ASPRAGGAETRSWREGMALVALAVLALESAHVGVGDGLVAASVAAHAVSAVGGAAAGRGERGQAGVAVEAADSGVGAPRDLEAGVVRRERGSFESGGEVTALAVGAESGAQMIDRGARRARVVGLVAGVAIDRRAGEPPVALVQVALLAGDGRVTSGEREVGQPVRVGAEAGRPAGRIVARGTAVSELAEVHVAVT